MCVNAVASKQMRGEKMHCLSNSLRLHGENACIFKLLSGLDLETYTIESLLQINMTYVNHVKDSIQLHMKDMTQCFPAVY